MTTWLDMKDAPRDGSRILLCFDMGNGELRYEMGQWEVQRYNKKPKPYWSGDCESYLGVTWYRNHEPIAWAKI